MELRPSSEPDGRPSAAPVQFRQASPADLAAVQRLIAAAYDKYRSRMDRPPAPLLRDYRSAIDSGSVWVTGTPVVGLISLIPADDVLLIENVRSTPTCRAPASGGG